MLNAFILFTLALGTVLPKAQQTPVQRHIESEDHEERMMDPPAPNVFQFTTPGGQVPFGILSSVQVNVNAQGQNIVGDAANEPSIVVDPLNPNNIAIGWRQFDSVTSNFRQAGYGYSTDGGKTWKFPGRLQSGVFQSDPCLSIDQNSNPYYLSLYETFYDTLWASPNWGQSYSDVGAAEGGDKEWMTIDRTNSVGRGNMYQTWSTAGNNYNGAQFTRSTNAGASWMTPINIPNQPFWGTLDVGPAGQCYVCGTDGNGALWFVRSSNAMNASQTPTFDLVTHVNMGGQINDGQIVNPGGLTGQLWIAADRSGGPTNGNIYMLASLTVNNSNPADVMFVRSTNGGTSFSAPIRINDDAVNSNHYHWFGTLSCAPNGRLDAIWYDTRNDVAGNTSEMFYSYSLDGGLTWAHNQQCTPSFNETVGYPDQNKIGDYIGMISDNTGANVAYSATFNNEEDIWFVRIPGVNQLPPDSFSLVRGLLVSGGLASMQYLDSASLVAQPGPTLNAGEAPLQIQLSAHSTVLSPVAFSFKLAAFANTGGLNQTISLYNFSTGAYVQVDSRAATTSEQTVTISPSGTLTNYVNQSTGEVRALVAYQAVGPTLTFPWLASLDQVQWTVTP